MSPTVDKVARLLWKKHQQDTVRLGSKLPPDFDDDLSNNDYFGRWRCVDDAANIVKLIKEIANEALDERP